MARPSMEQTLLLNATYEPLRIVHWQKAITLWAQGKVEIVAVYDREIRSVSFSIKLPSVIRLLRRQHLRPRLPHLPVLRRRVSDLGLDVRSRGPGGARRPQGLGEHRHLLH